MRKTRWSIFTLFCFFISFAVHADQIEDNGTKLQIIIPAAALLSTVVYEKNNNYEGSKQFAKSLTTTLLATGALKVITHKKRPNGANYNSFPSGHTSAAFMGAGFIHKRYGLKAAILPYVGASYVGYSRVYAKKHDTVDVLAGAALGIFTSRYFTSPYDKFSVTPVVTGDSVRVELSKKW